MSLESQPGARAIRVAVVDDHRLVIDGISAHFAAVAPEIEVAIETTTWAGLLEHDRFPVDVVLIDLNLEDNIAIGTKIRALSAAGTRTIVFSRHADAASIHGAIKAGALAFVPKTDTADELVLAVRSVVDGTHYRNQHVTDALALISTIEDPGLGKQEYRALVLYASGLSIREVAHEMSTTEETVKSYIKRGRRKYRAIGVDLGTKLRLRRHGIREGWLTPD
ncbi:MAG: DNA-binding response regulator [Microbacteriaceae bacterium]|nr:DNA-binding response regulator [Microbacteriaceae bacterium]